MFLGKPFSRSCPLTTQYWWPGKTNIDHYSCRNIPYALYKPLNIYLYVCSMREYLRTFKKHHEIFFHVLIDCIQRCRDAVWPKTADHSHPYFIKLRMFAPHESEKTGNCLWHHFGHRFSTMVKSARQQMSDRHPSKTQTFWGLPVFEVQHLLL